MDISQVRSGIPALKPATYLNTGTFGPSPSVVLDEVRQAFDLIEQHGAFSPVVRQAMEVEAYEAARSEAAALLGVEASEIALTRNSSDGINIVAAGLDWRPGDEVVITDHEHPSGILPWLTLAQRSGIRVQTVALDPDPEVTLERFQALINARTRLVFTSHVTSMSGRRLPVEAICGLAHAQNALVMVDGAHAAGQFEVRPGEIGCDAYVASGHKWLLGPQGASFTFVARERLETIQPSWIGWGAQVEGSLNLGAGSFTLVDSARRYEFGTKHWPVFPGLARAIRYIRDEVGLPAIEAQVRPMATRLKQAVAANPRFQLATPMEPAYSTGIVSFTTPGAPADLRERLWQRHKVIVAFDPALSRVRLSVAFFTLQEELDLGLAAIEDCLAE